MVSRASDSSTKLKKLEVEQGKEVIAGLPAVLSRLKKQIQASRIASVKEKVARNGSKLEASTSQLTALAGSRGDLCALDQMDNKNMLTLRTTNVLCKLNGFGSGYGDRDNINSQEELPSSAIVFGTSDNGKCAVRPVKIPFVEKIPPYTTWIFLARNQRMADDQSVVGRRQIYYDQDGGETLICSDSEGEVAEPEEEKHGFSEAEDQILWKALHQYGSDPEVFRILSQFVDATPSEITERYETLLKKYQDNPVRCSGSPEDMESERILSLDRTLAAALDSFDNLFCRRCYTFDCRLHGCSQSSILPSEKQPLYVDSEDVGKPCGDQCYLLRSAIRDSCEVVSTFGAMCCETEHLTSIDRVVTPVSDTENPNLKDGNMHFEILDGEFTNDDRGKRKVFKHEQLLIGSTKPAVEMSFVSAHKKQKMLSPGTVSVDDENQMDIDPGPVTSAKHPDSASHYDIQDPDKPTGESSGNNAEMDIVPCSIKLNECNSVVVEDEAISLNKATVVVSPDSCKGQNSLYWNPFEKDLFLKGLEIFGKNSCLIARNLLSGLKTCEEVFKYMFNDEATVLNRPILTNSSSENNATDPDYMEEMPTRTRAWRRRGRTRKLKYTWKSTGHPSIRKRIADGKEQCKKYVPCGCQQMCGKECPCHNNGTCCEKYCGCSKSCKNRFRGCHCAKSQCRSRQCPCYAAGRECDPDVCRNCWVSCGDGSLGEPPPRGDSYLCGNMKLLLKQQQRILLGKSNVAGWGAFIKSPVNKHDYLGEYTGELISHKEADKRGKIYDRANSSFLFDLNDQYVLDAYRKGDKLKFANHSSNPNCYAKVMLVAGDHRVGIFAKEHIEASEELFYDYRYGPDQAPAWARKPEGLKKDDLSASHSKRAHKVA